jgi:hypothetical protein
VAACIRAYERLRGAALVLLHGIDERGDLGVVGVDIEPRAERLIPRPCHHDRALFPFAQLRRDGLEIFPHLLVESVSPFRPVEGDQRDRIRHL